VLVGWLTVEPRKDGNRPGSNLFVVGDAQVGRIRRVDPLALIRTEILDVCRKRTLAGIMLNRSKCHVSHVGCALIGSGWALAAIDCWDQQTQKDGDEADTRQDIQLSKSG
jgi:hypothetical protein